MSRQLIALFVLAGALHAGAKPVAQGSAPDPVRARAEAGTAKLYDTSVLHTIDVVIAPEDTRKILSRGEERFPCTFTIDGRTLKNVGVRQSGGIYQGYVPIEGKPSLSLKFDEFEKGQRLFDLDKLVLKNERQDQSLVNEHLAYEVFRQAGLAAPKTAHARVTINGIDLGIYLMREPIDKEFLIRNFGKGFEDGNLYEIENVREFVYDPRYPKLDDEGKKGRTRDDLVRFAAAIAKTTPETFVKDLEPMLDIERFITYIAAEIATGHWDGITFRNNNTYIYAHPKDGRFIFIPYGADQAFGLSRGGFRRGMSEPVRSDLVRRMMAVPALSDRLTKEIARISREPVWSQKVLMDRLEQVGQIFAAAPQDGRIGSDINRFRALRASMENLVRAGGAVQ